MFSHTDLVLSKTNDDLFKYKCRPDPIICEECYEILFLVCATRKDGPNQLYESGAMDVLATHISTLPDGT